MNATAARPASVLLAQIVESAALAGGCPNAVFYLCAATQFEVAAHHGSLDIAPAPADQPLLAAARAQPGPLVVSDDARAPNPRDRTLLGPGHGRLGFIAAMRVGFGGFLDCGMLVLAAPAPRPFTAAQEFVLRAHAAQITTLLERHGAPALETQAAQNAELQAELQECRRAQARLHYIAFHDDLTMLRNRQYFMDRLAGAFARGTHEPAFRFAVLFLDLDRFKLVNDNFGHRAGDLLLIEVAERLRQTTRPQDVVARIGGDEFAVLVEGAEEMNFIAALAARIVETTRQPIRLGGQEIRSSCSVGAVQATRHYRLPEELLRDADLAMYRAKHEETGFTIFDDAMHNEAILRLQLRNDLQRAVARGELFVEYQPIFAAVGRRVAGVEALLRWQHPRRGRLEARDFIPAAADTEALRQICAWTLREACTQMQAWRQSFPALNLRLGLDVSAPQLKDTQFLGRLRDILASTQLAPGALQLEVPEHAFGEADGLGDTMAAIRALGVRIALDDFGSGSASIGYLDCYQIDTIKLNRTFTVGMPIEKRMAVVQAVTTLARALELEVVAAAVEDEAQLAAMRRCRCDYVQGSFLCASGSAGAIEVLLATQERQARSR